jgi:hypothetical protein
MKNFTCKQLAREMPDCSNLWDQNLMSVVNGVRGKKLFRSLDHSQPYYIVKDPSEICDTNGSNCHSEGYVKLDMSSDESKIEKTELEVNNYTPSYGGKESIDRVTHVICKRR